METARVARLERRVHELETLCAEVYVAGIELGLPQALIDRLWSIGAEGNLPVAFRLEPAPDRERFQAGRTPATASLPVPDLAQLDRLLGEAPAGQRRDTDGHLRPLPRKRVMVVDDDPLMVEVLLRILSHENFELLSANSGMEALERSSGQDLDLLITDFHMPGMTGPVVADRFRQRLPNLRVLYQTGFSDQLFEGRDELAEGEAFLEKPFSATGLREAARLVLFDRLNQ
ncbi:MAG: response regulator [Vicinamibacterales bacterium]